ncbi:hypothetical protein [Rhizobium sp. NRK18]|uniref:hypothetical protein n=1 Tax=Rhizobium sp. NRK18 TaxID=2964667 RepID=UPI0021C44778|nr:hypothetical protein [Rhizobium sp. NRK18]MCQ2005926.1 hypothetical protein [Rhizobium sp. NRK18]
MATDREISGFSATQRTASLVHRLGEALAGSHGRTPNLDAIRELVKTEVLDWQIDEVQKDAQADKPMILLTPSSKISDLQS